MVNNRDTSRSRKQKDPWVAAGCLPGGVQNGCNRVIFLFQSAMNVEHEVNLLVEEIHRLGSKSKYSNAECFF